MDEKQLIAIITAILMTRENTNIALAHEEAKRLWERVTTGEIKYKGTGESPTL